MDTTVQTIRKSVDIHAPREKVWEVLLQDRFTRIWYEAFCAGTQAETDWVLGSKARFTNGSGSGIVGQIVAHKPAELLSIEFDGIIAHYKEDYESPEAQKVKGSRETYRLDGNNGTTLLSIESDMDPEYFDAMSQAWSNALQKIKELAE